MDWIRWLVREPRCVGCDELFTDGDFCLPCQDEIIRVPIPGAVFLYAGPVQRVVLHWKERGDAAVGRALLRRMPRPPPADVVVPVPPAFWRTLRRGAHAPDQLAEHVGRMLSVPVVSRALHRLDDAPQMRLSGRVRRERSSPMFRAKKIASSLRGKRVLLVDDVRTTGTTLLHAARALRSAGVSEVDTLALALAI